MRRTVVKEATQESVVEINSIQKMVVNDEETNKIPKSTSEKKLNRKCRLR